MVRDHDDSCRLLADGPYLILHFSILYSAGFIDFGWKQFDEKTKIAKRAVELNQGRAAQMGLLGLMVHEKLGVSLLPATAVH
jgi:Chlorophyll A-B binding protein